MSDSSFQVFISYHRDDNETYARIVDNLARQIRGRFRAETGVAIEVFLDLDLRGGSNWEERLPAEICRSNVFIPIITMNYFQREHCLEELNQFLKQTSVEKQKATILPVVLAGREFINKSHPQVEVREIARLNWRDGEHAVLSGQSGQPWETLVAQLVTDLKAYWVAASSQATEEPSPHDARLMAEDTATGGPSGAKPAPPSDDPTAPEAGSASGLDPEAEPDPPQQSPGPGQWSALLGGTRSDGVHDAPWARGHSVRMALLMLLTVFLAAGSAGLAAQMTFSVPVFSTDGSPVGLSSPPAWVLVACGVGWGFITYSFNRLMVHRIAGAHGRRFALSCVSSGVIAAIVGAGQAVPFTLQVFASEIEQEVKLIQLEDQVRALTRVAELRDTYYEVQQKVADQQAVVIAARGGSPLEDNEAHQVAWAAYEQALSDCSAAQRRATLELRGDLPAADGGSDRAGAGVAYQELQAMADRLCSQVEAKRQVVKSIEESVSWPEETGGDAALDEAVLKQLQSQLDLLAEQLISAQHAAASAGTSRGIEIRLHALARVLSHSNTAKLAHLSMTTMLIVVAAFPTMAEVIHQWIARRNGRDRPVDSE